MIDPTETLKRVRAELVHDYEFYGFKNFSSFRDRIIEVSEETKFRKIITAVTETVYGTLVTATYSGLTGTQINIFYAEVFYICADFIGSLKNAEIQGRKAVTETVTIDGYTRAMDGSTGLEKSEGWYAEKAAEHMSVYTG
jgi:hypothetical protein